MRKRMLKGLRAGNITDERVLSAFGAVPRGKFVSSPVARIRVSLPIPSIGHDQTLCQELGRQLKDGGRLVIPLGRQLSKVEMALSMLRKRPSPQQLYRFTKLDGHTIKERFEDVYFVPFVGA